MKKSSLCLSLALAALLSAAAQAAPEPGQASLAQAFVINTEALVLSVDQNLHTISAAQAPDWQASRLVHQLIESGGHDGKMSNSPLTGYRTEGCGQKTGSFVDGKYIEGAEQLNNVSVLRPVA